MSFPKMLAKDGVKTELKCKKKIKTDIPLIALQKTSLYLQM